MPLIREILDGRVHYRQDPLDPDKPVMFTGPVSKPVQLPDGTVVDVSPDFIELDSHEQAGLVSHLIGVAHETDGHPNHLSRYADGYDPFRDEFHHTCTAACGELARTPDEQEAEFAERLRRIGHGNRVGEDSFHETLSRLGAMRAAAEG
jgi:hypothetical protein